MPPAKLEPAGPPENLLLIAANEAREARARANERAVLGAGVRDHPSDVLRDRTNPGTSALTRLEKAPA